MSKANNVAAPASSKTKAQKASPQSSKPATKPSAVKPSPVSQKPSDDKPTRPLPLKSRKILFALNDGPKTRKEILEFCKEQNIKMDSSATTAYLGSVKTEIREKWDKVAADPTQKSWNHVSLIGLQLVSYSPETKKFTLDKSGVPVANAVAQEFSKN